MATLKLKGGDKLKARLDELARNIGRGGVLAVGFFEGADYPDGTPVATVAAIQNFGAPARGIPPRPFFSRMIEQNSPKWGDALARILKSVDFDVERALELMGQGIAGQLRQAIVDMNSPPLSEVTLMLRKMQLDDPGLVVTGATVGEAARRVASGETAGLSGSQAKPLVRPIPGGGKMLDSIGHEVTAL